MRRQAFLNQGWLRIEGNNPALRGRTYPSISLSCYTQPINAIMKTEF